MAAGGHARRGLQCLRGQSHDLQRRVGRLPDRVVAFVSACGDHLSVRLRVLVDGAGELMLKTGKDEGVGRQQLSLLVGSGAGLR